jgi:hypothetical protein
MGMHGLCGPEARSRRPLRRPPGAQSAQSMPCWGAAMRRANVGSKDSASPAVSHASPHGTRRDHSTHRLAHAKAARRRRRGIRASCRLSRQAGKPRAQLPIPRLRLISAEIILVRADHRCLHSRGAIHQAPASCARRRQRLIPEADRAATMSAFRT